MADQYDEHVQWLLDAALRERTTGDGAKIVAAALRAAVQAERERIAAGLRERAREYDGDPPLALSLAEGEMRHHAARVLRNEAARLVAPCQECRDYGHTTPCIGCTEGRPPGAPRVEAQEDDEHRVGDVWEHADGARGEVVRVLSQRVRIPLRDAGDGRLLGVIEESPEVMVAHGWRRTRKRNPDMTETIKNEAEKAGPPFEHSRDEDCDVGADGCCEVCGVSHGGACSTCGGAGFHRIGCPDWMREERGAIDAETREQPREGEDMTTERESTKRLLLPSPDAPRDRIYSMPDPIALAWAFDEAYRATWYGPRDTHVAVPRGTMIALLGLAEGYLGICRATTTSRAMQMVRDVRRRVRAAKEGT